MTFNSSNALEVRTKDGVKFGKELREKEFLFDKAYLPLNHGMCIACRIVSELMVLLCCFFCRNLFRLLSSISCHFLTLFLSSEESSPSFSNFPITMSCTLVRMVPSKCRVPEA
jgi:hypothetical protein